MPRPEPTPTAAPSAGPDPARLRRRAEVLRRLARRRRLGRPEPRRGQVPPSAA